MPKNILEIYTICVQNKSTSMLYKYVTLSFVCFGQNTHSFQNLVVIHGRVSAIKLGGNDLFSIGVGNIFP